MQSGATAAPPLLRNDVWCLPVHGSTDREEEAQSTLNGVDYYAAGAEADWPAAAAGIIDERYSARPGFLVAIERAGEHVRRHLPVEACTEHPVQPCVARCPVHNFAPLAKGRSRLMRAPVVTVLLRGCLSESAAAGYRGSD
jgi:hypothetical protein